MPVGPSYRDVCSPRRSASSGVGAEPTTGTGRVWATSARNAPSVSSRSAPSWRPTSTIEVANVRHRTFGSLPTKITTSRLPARAAENSHDGHSITRLTPSTSFTTGRVTWKSKNSSGSSVANRRASHRSAR